MQLLFNFVHLREFPSLLSTFKEILKIFFGIQKTLEKGATFFRHIPCCQYM